jgi:hypothetical protein
MVAKSPQCHDVAVGHSPTYGYRSREELNDTGRRPAGGSYIFPMNWLRNRRPATLYTAAIVVFLISRIVFFLITTAGEYRLYKSYGDDARATSLAELYRNRVIEYPHLGVAFGAAVGFVADHLPDGCKHLVRLRPNKWEWPYAEEPQDQRDADDQYEAALGLTLFALDAWCLWLVFAIARRVYPDETPLIRVGRLLVYSVSVGLCGLILFDRQDLVVAWLGLLALWCLTVSRPRPGYAALVIGAAYKMVPALLLPVWVIAAATVRCGSKPSFIRWVRLIVLEAVIAGTILSLWPLLTYAFGGEERGFLYLTWHSKRGLQLEAPAAFPVLLADPTVEFGSSYGSFNLRGDLPDRVAKVKGVLMPLTALGCLVISARGFWNALPAAPTLLALMPHVIRSTMLLWVTFIAFNKVGSPQYLLWVSPLVPLMPMRSWSERGWVLLLAFAMLDTMIIYPCRYSEDLVGPFLHDNPLTWRGPNTLGVVLLGIKSITLVACSMWLAVLVWRTPVLPAATAFPVGRAVPDSNLMTLR